MVHATDQFSSSRAFRIRKRSLLTRLKLQRVFPAMSALLFVLGMASLWYIQAAQAGVTQWTSLSSTKQISAGGAHTCAIEYDEKAYCWGSNSNGQLGNNSTTQSLAPVLVSNTGLLGGKTVLSITAGHNHTCSIASDGAGYCWGWNGNGQLGNNSTSQSLVPVAVNTAGVLSGKTLWSISARGYHTCTLASDSQSYCWGYNADGELGNNTKNQSLVPMAVETSGVLFGKSVTAVSTGFYFTCAIASGLPYCWGTNWGNLGNSTSYNSQVPVAVTTSGVLAGKTVLSMSSGDFHTCVIASDNQVYCWGSSNSNGQRGDGSAINSYYLYPTAVSTSGVLSGKTILAVTSGTDHSCVIASDNQAYCWGKNDKGQLGNNLNTDSNVPVAVDTSGVLAGKTLVSIDAGGSTTCATATDGAMYCWGRGGDGELGNNTTTDSLVPVAVTMSGTLSGKTITSISVGSIHTCAIVSDNKVYCWGYNGYGQFGNGTNSSSLVPVAAMNTGPLASSAISSLSAGGIHTCVIASDNYEYCSGFNSEGALGNGTTITTNVPTAVDRQGVLAGKTILSMSTNWINSCAVASDNNAYCWGENGEGQIGNLAVPTYFSTRPTRTATSYMSGPRLFAGDNTFKLQFAKRTTTTCSVQSTGFADVTESSAIAYNTNASVTHTAAISTAANDPVPANDALPQTYQSASGTFTNITDIEPGKTGLWDFSLKTNGAERNTSYCLRLTYGDGTPIELSQAYPEVMVPAASLAVGFVDGVGAPISKPTFAMNATSEKTSLQSVTGTFADSARKLRVFNDLVTNGWSVSLAATTGNTAVWKRSDNLAQYAFNANATSGQLSINPGTGSIASACGTTGTSLGASANFVQGSQDSVTLFTASSAAPLGCAYDFTGAALTQTIPAQQAAGAYTLDMTATVVAL